MHRGSTTSYHIELLLVVIISLIHLSVSSSLTLTLENNTLQIGESALFRCQVDTSGNCDSDFIWFGGEGHKFLCQNKSCQNPIKYNEKNMGQCISMLEMNDVRDYDITTYVTCQYGFSQARIQIYPFDNRNTTLLVLPSSNNIIFNVTPDANLVQVFVQFLNIYPEPRCEIQSKTDTRLLNVTKHGMLYDAFINTSMSLILSDDCLLRATCSLGGQNVTLFEKNIPDICNHKIFLVEHAYHKAEVHWLAFIVVGVVVSIIICCTLFRYSKHICFDIKATSIFILNNSILTSAKDNRLKNEEGQNMLELNYKGTDFI